MNNWSRLLLQIARNIWMNSHKFSRFFLQRKFNMIFRRNHVLVSLLFFNIPRESSQFKGMFFEILKILYRKVFIHFHSTELIFFARIRYWLKRNFCSIHFKKWNKFIIEWLSRSKNLFSIWTWIWCYLNIFYI